MDITLTFNGGTTCVLTEGTDWDAVTSNLVTAQNIEAAAESECSAYLISADDDATDTNGYTPNKSAYSISVATSHTPGLGRIQRRGDL
jgi:hypothetical protein